ncbi:hypothetical protein [Demequina capsici]|uniref:Uncharacterized protein n=1 Tax=Demequina capsici TaxID=3075620 RepID=A0AA96FBA1_9MICO|nr:hypothetical protein [Demequina sp. OYTSA14]WNM25100.1 hypothetical protein RN606_02845 [Demequina sp. OYTSA14]
MPDPLLIAVPVLIVAALVVWVYVDASSRAGTPRQVVARIGTFSIETPLQWLVLCIVLMIGFLPLYLVARRESG